MSSACARGGVSAIVVSYFTGPTLARCIASLVSQPEIEEIIIVNNGNRPGAIRSAIETIDGEDYPVFHILSGHGNIGFAAGCNKGSLHAGCDVLLFINPDAVIPHGGVGALLAAAETISPPWLIAPRLVDQLGTEQQGSRRSTLTLLKAMTEFSRAYRLLPLARFNLHEEPLPDAIAPMPVISGACFLLPRDDFWRVGGMDDGYFLHFEDVDFCQRFGEVGRVYFAPQVAVVHYQGSSRANAASVERAKVKSFSRYADLHFNGKYPQPLVWLTTTLMRVAIEARIAVQRLRTGLKFTSLVVRKGPQAGARAKRLFANPSARLAPHR